MNDGIDWFKVRRRRLAEGVRMKTHEKERVQYKEHAAREMSELAQLLDERESAGPAQTEEERNEAATLRHRLRALRHNIDVIEAVDELPSAAEKPPAAAEWLLVLLVSKKHIEGLLGDLEERFARNVAKRGQSRAQSLYWAEALRSLAPLIWAKARHLGIFAAFVAAARYLMR